MAALISVPATDIPIEGTELDVELPAAWLDEALTDASAAGPQQTELEVRSRAGAGKLVGRLSRSGVDVVVRGRVTVELQATCVRCLGPAPLHIDAELSLLLQPVTPGAGIRTDEAGEHEFAAEEADLDVFDGETVELDHFVREAILLELPIFPLCSESCPGIGAVPSSQPGLEAVDPRLAPLEALRAKLGGEPTPIAEPLPHPKPMLRSTIGRGLPKKKKKKRE